MPYSRIQYLCWLFSGAEISLLKECPTDYNRQASIGFTILMTCLFAGMAGGFAAWRFSEGSILAAVIFGIVWAMLIFSIDRSMVVTLKKDPTKQEGSRGKFLAFTARMVLAGLLAFLISLPLETYIFNTQIESEISRQNIATPTNIRKKLEEGYGLPALRKEQDNLLADKQEAEQNGKLPEPSTGLYKAAAERARSLNTDYQQLNNQHQSLLNKAAAFKQRTPNISVEQDGQLVTHPDYNSRNWRNYRAFTSQAKALFSDLKTKRTALDIANSNKDNVKKQFYDNNANLVDDLKKKLDQRIEIINKKIVQIEKRIEIELPIQTKGGFVREFTALEDASKGNAGLFLMLWLIRAMFFIIELLPTIVKMVTPIGEYDRQLHAHEQLFALALRTNYSIMEGRERLRQQTEQRIAEQLEQARLDRELELGKNVLEKTATYQNDLAERMLKDWHKKEREKQKAAAAPKAPANPPVAAYTPSVAQQPPVAAPTPAPAVAAPTPHAQPTTAPATTEASVPPIVAEPVQAGQPASLSAPSAITLAALTAKQFWWLKPDNRRNWYAFENGSTNNRVRRKINGGDIENGRWEHPNEDKSLLRITFNTEAEEYNIQRLTNTEMVLRNAASNDELSFLA